MTDIVERLKNTKPREICEHGSQRVKCPLCNLEQAEAEIERLRAEVKRLSTTPTGAHHLSMDVLMSEAAKVGQLNDEIERLRDELETWKSVFPDIAPEHVQPDRSLLEAEIERLREENQQMRKALEKIEELDRHKVLHEAAPFIAHQTLNQFRSEIERLAADLKRWGYGEWSRSEHEIRDIHARHREIYGYE